MVKRITISVLLVLIIGVSIFQNIVLSSASERLSAILEDLIAALEVEDYEQATVLANLFDERWNEEKHVYEMLFKHEELDLISESAVQLPWLCTSYSQRDALAEANVTLFYLQHIVDIDSVNWENIF